MDKLNANINKREIFKQCPYISDWNIGFDYRPLRDICFIWPFPTPTTLGSLGVIEIPEQFRKKHKTNYGILLAIGPGYQDDKGKIHDTYPELIPGAIVLYDKTVPWFIIDEIDNQKIYIVTCTQGDIKGIME
jgi:co-chaperonin GroES (HSP10)